MKYLPMLALLAAPLPAMAETQAEQFEALSERTNNLMLHMLVDAAVADGADRATLEAALPNFEWNDAMRESGTCMLEAYTAKIGSDGVDQLMVGMNQFLDETENMTIEEMAAADPDYLPDGLTEQESLEITQTCGMLDAQLDWMADSGFMEAMMSQAQ